MQPFHASQSDSQVPGMNSSCLLAVPKPYMHWMPNYGVCVLSARSRVVSSHFSAELTLILPYIRPPVNHPPTRNRTTTTRVYFLEPLSDVLGIQATTYLRGMALLRRDSGHGRNLAGGRSRQLDGLRLLL